MENGLSDTVSFDAQVKHHYRRNFIVNVLDGANFWFGYSFLGPAVILPLFVSHYTDNTLLIGLITMFGSVGYFLPQLFTANWVEGLPVKKIGPVVYGLYLERLPLILLPIAVLLFKDISFLVLLSLFLFYGWHCFGAGSVAVAWNDMIAKVIPQERRGFFFGFTNFMGAGTGILGASVAAWLLSRFEFPTGFVINFAVAGLFVALSWIFISLTREVPLTNRQEKVSTRDYWRKLPAILKGDVNFSRFLLVQAVLGLSGMLWGFIAVYSQQTWNLSDGRVGIYATVMLVGQSLANLAFGAYADRKGYKIVIEISALASALSILISIIAPDPNLFFAVFFLRGISVGGFYLSSMMVFEFSAPETRPTYIGLNNTLIGVISSIAPMLGGLLAEWMGYRGMFIISLVPAVLGLVMLRTMVREPRRKLHPVGEIESSAQ
jgi:MFS family permease